MKVEDWRQRKNLYAEKVRKWRHKRREAASKWRRHSWNLYLTEFAVTRAKILVGRDLDFALLSHSGNYQTRIVAQNTSKILVFTVVKYHPEGENNLISCHMYSYAQKLKE